MESFPLSSSPTVENIGLLSTGTDDALRLKEFLALGNSPVPQQTRGPSSSSPGAYTVGS